MGAASQGHWRKADLLEGADIGSVHFNAQRPENNTQSQVCRLIPDRPLLLRLMLQSLCSPDQLCSLAWGFLHVSRCPLTDMKYALGAWHLTRSLLALLQLAVYCTASCSLRKTASASDHVQHQTCVSVRNICHTCSTISQLDKRLF